MSGYFRDAGILSDYGAKAARTNELTGVNPDAIDTTGGFNNRYALPRFSREEKAALVERQLEGESVSVGGIGPLMSSETEARRAIAQARAAT